MNRNGLYLAETSIATSLGFTTRQIRLSCAGANKRGRPDRTDAVCYWG